uniref:Protein inturned n=1 Tax=Glossina pallidipes TaxID=7398 RepID=A0A1A9ZU29_GLOPL
MRRSHTLLLEEAKSVMESNDCGSDSYSSNTESCTESYGDGSETANWEEYVNEDGLLFYAEYVPFDLNKCSNSADKFGDISKNCSLRFSKKHARRPLHQNSKLNQEIKEPGESELKFADIDKRIENCKTLELVITASDRYRFGRRSTAVESILGFRVAPFPDQPERLMVESFVHDMPALLQQEKLVPILKGDWFKSLNDIEIHTSNVDALLLQFIEPTRVCLTFQGRSDLQHEAKSSGTSNTNDKKRIINFDMFASTLDKLLNLSPLITEQFESILMFALLILPPECYQNEEHKNSLFYYPEDINKNFLYKARGSFLTLHTVLSEELKTKPSASKLTFDNSQYYACYRNINGFLVLFSFPCAFVNLSESNLRADELINYMHFALPHIGLDSFKNSYFRNCLINFCNIQRVRLLLSYKKHSSSFEEILRESRYLPLPKEAQLRIFDALSEMESMDYRNWNDEPLHTHREFFIYGSVLYFNHFILISQMPLEMRLHTEVSLRCRGIFDFVSRNNVKELYIWEEIELNNLTGRYFLTVCGRNHLILAVILKMFEAPDVENGCKISPSLFYIEEIQETLDHLIRSGIESLAMFWSVSNKRPEILEGLLSTEGHDSLETYATKKFDMYLKHKLASPSSSSKELATNTSAQTQRIISYDEDTLLCSSLGGSSVHSLTLSEEELSKKRLVSNPIGDESDSGSDWENFSDRNPLHYTGFESDTQSQVTESLWKEISNVVPTKVSAGWKNSIYYYLYIDHSNSTVFCPLKSSAESFPYVQEMRQAFHFIHNILQKTKCLRRDANKVHSQDITLIRECGMTVQVQDKFTPNNDLMKARFVVVGRFFQSSQTEIYICHRPEIPQNMVELAFRLSFYSFG